MKKQIPYLLLFVCCLGCKKEHKLTFEHLKLDNASCKNCPNIKIDIPNMLDETPTAKNINTALHEELIFILNFDEVENVASIKQAMQSFSKSYQNLQEKYGDETIGWEAEIRGAVIYEDKNVITVQLNTYTFTGGAHGYRATTFLNFEKQNGLEFRNHQLFNNYRGFEALAEKLFREKEQIPVEENINATGFMFDGDNFHLSSTIGYTREGIQLFYNPYEVASYANGPIILTIPFEKANDYLKYRAEP